MACSSATVHRTVLSCRSSSFADYFTVAVKHITKFCEHAFSTDSGLCALSADIHASADLTNYNIPQRTLNSTLAFGLKLTTLCQILGLAYMYRISRQVADVCWRLLFCWCPKSHMSMLHFTSVRSSESMISLVDEHSNLLAPTVLRIHQANCHCRQPSLCGCCSSANLESTAYWRHRGWFTSNFSATVKNVFLFQQLYPDIIFWRHSMCQLGHSKTFLLDRLTDWCRVIRRSVTSRRYALINEPLTGSSATICGGSGNGIGRSSDRERHVYTSRSHRVGVQLLHTNNAASFLLKFEGMLHAQSYYYYYLFFWPRYSIPEEWKITLCNIKSTKIKLEWTLLLLLLHKTVMQ